MCGVSPPDPTQPPGAQGKRVSTDEISAQVYGDLKKIAASFFARENPEMTLQPTAVVHEAYMALAEQDKQTWANRAHFLAIAARAMRRVLADAAKARGRLKRGGGWQRVTLSLAETDAVDQQANLLDLDQALSKLEKVKERYARIVELRFFAGLTNDEVARVLGISSRMVGHEWAKAQAWLALHLEDHDAGPEED